MNLIIPRGELQRRALEKNILTRALEVCEPDDFADVELMTMQSWGKEMAFCEAYNTFNDKGTTLSDVLREATKLHETKYSKCKEFVEVFNDKWIRVVMDVPKIDDAATDKALELLSKIEKLKPGTKVEFRDEVTDDSQHPPIR